MAISASPRGTANFLSNLQEAICREAAQTLLGNKELSSRTQKKLSSMGISGRTFLLVYLRNHLGRDNSNGLEQEDKNVQGLRAASAIADSSKDPYGLIRG